MVECGPLQGSMRRPKIPLQWRHNGHDSVSNHQPHDCLLNPDADQRKYQITASLAYVRGIHQGPVNFPHKWPVTRKMFPFDDVIMTVVVRVWMSNHILQKQSLPTCADFHKNQMSQFNRWKAHRVVNVKTIKPACKTVYNDCLTILLCNIFKLCIYLGVS